MAPDDGVPPPASDLSAYRRARQVRQSDALIEMFAAVLGRPLELRELTPAQRAARDARVSARRERRGAGWVGGRPLLQPITELPPVRRAPGAGAAPEPETGRPLLHGRGLSAL